MALWLLYHLRHLPVHLRLLAIESPVVLDTVVDTPMDIVGLTPAGMDLILEEATEGTMEGAGSEKVQVVLQFPVVTGTEANDCRMDLREHSTEREAGDGPTDECEACDAFRV